MAYGEVGKAHALVPERAGDERLSGARDEQFVGAGRDIGDARSFGAIRAARIFSPTRDSKQHRFYVTRKM